MGSALETRLQKPRQKSLRRHDLEARTSLLGQRLARFLAHFEDTEELVDAKSQLGISQAAYLLYRRNQGNPTIGSLAVMAVTLGCSVYTILGFENKEVRTAYMKAGLAYDPDGEHEPGELLAQALAHMEVRYQSQAAAVARSGAAPTVYSKYRQNKGNPTFKSLEWMAENFGLNVYEFLWFNLDDVRSSYRRAGLDYDKMASQVRRQNRAAAHYDHSRTGAGALASANSTTERDQNPSLQKES